MLQFRHIYQHTQTHTYVHTRVYVTDNMLTVHDWLYAKASQSTTINSFHCQSKRLWKHENLRLSVLVCLRVCVCMYLQIVCFSSTFPTTAMTTTTSTITNRENMEEEYGALARKRKWKQSEKTHISGSCVNLNAQLLTWFSGWWKGERAHITSVFWAQPSTWFGNDTTTVTSTMKMAIFERAIQCRHSKKISNVAEHSRVRAHVGF